MDVVDAGYPRRARLTPAHVVELHRVAHQRPSRADASVQRRGGRRPEDFLHGQRCPPQRSRESRRGDTRLPPFEAPRAARRDSSAPSATARAASLVAPGAGGASHGESVAPQPRSGPRRTAAGRPPRRTARPPARVDLGHDPAAAVDEARRQADLPQRPGAIERRTARCRRAARSAGRPARARASPAATRGWPRRSPCPPPRTALSRGAHASRQQARDAL